MGAFAPEVKGMFCSAVNRWFSPARKPGRRNRVGKGGLLGIRPNVGALHPAVFSGIASTKSAAAVEAPFRRISILWWPG